MSKITRNSYRGGVGSSSKSSSTHRSVTVGRNYVTVKYRSCGENRTIKLSNKSIIASGREALAKVPVIFD